MKEDLTIKNINLILIQIHEAHSSSWPAGLKDQPEPHKNMEDRINKALEFKKKYGDFNVYVDTWENEYDNLFRSWPDKYYALD